MQIPLEISFRNMEPSDAIEKDIRVRAEALEKFASRITSCRVLVEAPHRHHLKGKHFHVRVDITVPGEEIVVRRDPDEHEAHQDCHVAIHDAFKAARRQLEDHVRRRRGDVKQHEEHPVARVIRLFPQEGYGFLETPDGRQIYFHQNSVLEHAFPQLGVGSEVRFLEEAGEKGPQATSVKPVGRAP